MKRILFVCSGNTCRSPMAQTIFNAEAANERIDAESVSAGLFTSDGLEYSKNSVLVLEEKGHKLQGKSRAVTKELLDESDAVFFMTEHLANTAVSMFPEFASKIYVFPIEVPDPYGKDIDAYRNCLKIITAGIKIIVSAIEKGVL